MRKMAASIALALLAVGFAGAAERFVSKGNAGAAAPYDTPATAAPEIQAAINASAAGDVVTVAASASAYEPFTLGKDVTVRGATGNFGDVVVDGVSTATCAVLASPGAVVSSLTVTRGQPRGIEMTGGTVTNCHVTQCCIKGGTASEDIQGSGVYNNGGRLLDTVIDRCYSFNHHYGIGLYQTGAAAVSDRLVITNNYANRMYSNRTDASGAGALLAGGILRNSVIAFNTPGEWVNAGGNMRCATGVRVNGGRMVNCTVYGNYITSGMAVNYAGVVAEKSGTVENCIIAGNGRQGSPAVMNWTGLAANFIHAATTPTAGLSAETVDITAAGWSFSASGAVLSPESPSPLVDAGAAGCTAADCGATDFFGNPRLVNGFVDIGHEECRLAALGVNFSSSAGFVGMAPFAGSLAATAAGDTAGVVYYWDLDGDGVTDLFGADQTNAPFSFQSPGNFTVTLWATNAVGDAASFSRLFRAKTMTQYVDSRAANPREPYATPETAAADIQSAIDVAEDGGEIIVLRGSLLRPSIPVLVGKPVTIRGETGDFRDAIVSHTGPAHRIFHVTAPGAVLASMTIRDGSGGVFLDGGGCVTNCRVTACNGSGSGVGVYCDNGFVVDSVIDGITMLDTSNAHVGEAHYLGLGLYLAGEGALADRCVVTNCTSPVVYADGGIRRGAAVALEGGSLRNSYVARNNAGKVVRRAQGALLASGVSASGSAKVDNCTVAGNRIQGSSAGLVAGIRLAGAAVARNCIALDNGNGFEEVCNWAGAAASFQNLLSTGAAGVPGGVEAAGEAFATDPRDALPALPLASPARDAGAALDWMDASSRDIRGNARAAGAAPDVGCCEITSDSLACSFAATALKGVETLATTITPSVTGPAASAPGLVVGWDVDGDGLPDATTGLAPFTQTIGADGSHYGDRTVTMVVTVPNPGGAPAVATFSRTFTLAPARVYATNGNAAAAYPYATPETAAGDVQTAIDAAFDGSEVVVLPSAAPYATANTISITRDITLSGATGDFGDVVIDGQGKGRVMRIDAPGALVRDVTIANGRGLNNVHSSGGCGVRMVGGELRHCRVTRCRTADGTFATGVWCDNGRLVDCLVDGNYNGGGHTAGLGVLALGSSALVDRCVFTNNNSSGFYWWDQYRVGVVTVYDGTIRNSLVAHNDFGTAQYIGTCWLGVGLFADGAAVENCSVVGNRYTAGAFTNASAGICAVGGATVANTLVDANEAPDGPFNHRIEASARVSHCSTDPVEGLAGEGNFLPMASDYQCPPGGLFALPRGSRLVGRGENAPWMEDALDLYGRPRRVCRHVDVGCLEDPFVARTLLLLH